MSERTPGEVYVTEYRPTEIWGKDHMILARADFPIRNDEEAKANAEFIMRSWNAHDDLVAACEVLLADTERGHLYLDADMTALLEAAIDKAKAKPAQ